MSAAYLAGFQSKSSKRIIFVPCLLYIHLNLILFIRSYNQMKWITHIQIADCLMHSANSSMSRINSSGGGIWPHVVPTRQLLRMLFTVVSSAKGIRWFQFQFPNFLESESELLNGNSSGFGIGTSDSRESLVPQIWECYQWVFTLCKPFFGNWICFEHENIWNCVPKDL